MLTYSRLSLIIPAFVPMRHHTNTRHNLGNFEKLPVGQKIAVTQIFSTLFSSPGGDSLSFLLYCSAQTKRRIVMIGSSINNPQGILLCAASYESLVYIILQTNKQSQISSIINHLHHGGFQLHKLLYR